MKSITEIFNPQEKQSLISTKELTQLIKSEERLQIVKDYVKSEQYVSKDTLLVLLGEKADAEQIYSR